MDNKFLQAVVFSFLLIASLVASAPTGDEAKLASTPLTASVNGVTLPVSSTTELGEWDRVGALILQQPQPGSLAWAQPLVDTRIPCFRGLDDEKLKNFSERVESVRKYLRDLDSVLPSGGRRETSGDLFENLVNHLASLVYVEGFLRKVGWVFGMIINLEAQMATTAFKSPYEKEISMFEESLMMRLVESRQDWVPAVDKLKKWCGE